MIRFFSAFWDFSRDFRIFWGTFSGRSSRFWEFLSDFGTFFGLWDSYSKNSRIQRFLSCLPLEKVFYLVVFLENLGTNILFPFCTRSGQMQGWFICCFKICCYRNLDWKKKFFVSKCSKGEETTAKIWITKTYRFFFFFFLLWKVYFG